MGHASCLPQSGRQDACPTVRVAFRRATVEHSFRVAKSEAGLVHYEGRQYVGLVRHLILALIVLGFVSVPTNRLRGWRGIRRGRWSKDAGR